MGYRRNRNTFRRIRRSELLWGRNSRSHRVRLLWNQSSMEKSPRDQGVSQGLEAEHSLYEAARSTSITIEVMRLWLNPVSFSVFPRNTNIRLNKCKVISCFRGYAITKRCKISSPFPVLCIEAIRRKKQLYFRTTALTSCWSVKIQINRIFG